MGNIIIIMLNIMLSYMLNITDQMAKKKARQAYRIGSKGLSTKPEYLLRGLISTQMHTEYVQFPTWKIM